MQIMKMHIAIILNHMAKIVNSESNTGAFSRTLI